MCHFSGVTFLVITSLYILLLGTFIWITIIMHRKSFPSSGPECRSYSFWKSCEKWLTVFMTLERLYLSQKVVKSDWQFGDIQGDPWELRNDYICLKKFWKVTDTLLTFERLYLSQKVVESDWHSVDIRTIIFVSKSCQKWLTICWHTRGPLGTEERSS